MRKRISFGLFLIMSFLLWSTIVYAQCNGCQSLCDKRYNEVAYLTTHNAFNAEEDGFRFANQVGNVTTQLADGVRSLMLDVYEDDAQLVVYHGYKWLGSKSFVSVLEEVEAFMDANPREVLTIILECYVTADQVESAFADAKLSDLLYTKAEEQWPTLATMIDQNKRLVVLSDKDDASKDQGWYHYMWDHAVETHYSNSNNDDFTCDFNRGAEDAEQKDLFIFNHFLTRSALGVGSKRKTKRANQSPFLIDRLRKCTTETGKFPNFVTVDFYEIGDSKSVIEELNEVPISCQQ